MSLSAEQLVGAIWCRHNAAMAAQDPVAMEAVARMRHDTVLSNAIEDAARNVNEYLSVWVDFEALALELGVKIIGIYGESDETLDAAIWTAVCEGHDVLDVTKSWLVKNVPHALHC